MEIIKKYMIGFHVLRFNYLFRGLLIFFVLLSRFNIINAQTTGSFTKTVQFGGARTLAYYVPTSYSSSTKYKLVIGLHGSGGNGTQYRDAIQSNSTSSISPLYNCIIVCPDGNQSTPDKNFYSPPGYEEIIRVGAIQPSNCITSIQQIFILMVSPWAGEVH